MKIEIESSYRKNNIGKTIYKMVLKYQPEIVIDFGILYGYSTICMALALKKINKKGKVYAYDLWDKYPYKHATVNEVEKNIKKYNLCDFVVLKKMDFFEWIENPPNFDFLHLDISNDGDIIETAYNKLYHRMNKNSVIIFEGGTKRRDKEKWMIKYKKKSILPLKKKIRYKIINYRWPGLSLIEKY